MSSIWPDDRKDSTNTCTECGKEYVSNVNDVKLCMACEDLEIELIHKAKEAKKMNINEEEVRKVFGDDVDTCEPTRLFIKLEKKNN